MHEQGTLPPGLMFRSFMTVGSGYMLHDVFLFGITAILGYCFFPEFAAFQELGPERRQQIMELDPHQAIPKAMFWSMVGLVGLTCAALGVFVVWTAPFSQFAHVIFLAVLLFVHYLQTSMGDPPAKKSLTLVYMAVFPIAVLIGGHWANNRQIKKLQAEYDAAESSPDHSDES